MRVQNCFPAAHKAEYKETHYACSTMHYHKSSASGWAEPVLLLARLWRRQWCPDNSVTAGETLLLLMQLYREQQWVLALCKCKCPNTLTMASSLQAAAVCAVVCSCLPSQQLRAVYTV